MTSSTSSIPCTPVALGHGVHLLPLAYELDGRVSTHRLDASGYACMNCLLVVEGQDALLLETGFSAHEPALFDALDAVLDSDSQLAVWIMRIGEYAAVCNVRPVVERYGVDRVFSSFSNPAVWVDFRPEHSAFGSDVGGGALARVTYTAVRRGDRVPLGDTGRALLATDAPLRLLPVGWAYDEASRTLFTADAFSYVWRPTQAGPWVVTAEDDDTTPEAVWDHLIGTRFWWLAGADTSPIRAQLADIFDTHDIGTIVPAFGCALHGRSVVERHVGVLDELLAEASAQPSLGLEVAGWRFNPSKEPTPSKEPS